MAIRPIRTNNAGDLRAPDEATGRRWWGKHGFVGLDDDGFAIFETPQGGVAALEQQIRIDQGRDQTQAEFIDKYVGASVDPKGAANAQRNIPQFTGASPDTALADIDTDALVRAITRSEGGQDSLQHFGLDRGNFLAIDRAQGQRGQRQEAERLVGQTPAPAPPELPMSDPPFTSIEQVEPVQPTAPAATNGADLAAVDERLRTLNELTGADIPVMRDRTPTGRTTPTGLTDDELRKRMESQFTGFDAFFHGADIAADDAAKAKADQARQKQSKMGRGRFTLDQPERPDTGFELSPLPDTPSRESRPLGFMRPFTTTPPTQQVEETVEEAPAPAAKPVVETQETPQEDAPAGSILSRIGRYAKENPDIALAGMEGIGNLLANIGAARGQRKADEATQQGMARSNLISALTGGRVRPAVAEETPEMGLLGRVGQAVGTAGKLGREVEQERAERGFKQQEADRKAADLDRKIDADALKLQDLIRKEKYTDAQIENFLARNTLGMEKNEIARYRAEVYDRLGTGRLELDRDRFTQAQAEFDFVKQMDLRGIGLKEERLGLDQRKFDLAYEGAQREYEMQMKKFGLDVKRVEALEKDVETRAKRAASYAEQVALNTMTARGEQKREVRKIIDGLSGKELNRMMDPKQGTAAIMQGLNAAYRDFQVDPNQANMNAVFQMYQRLFDPATVREGDLAIQKEGQGEILRAIASMERLSGGGFVIARSVIEDMKEIADRYNESARKSATNTLNNYIKNAVLGTDPTPLETAQAEAIRNYYTSIWSYDPLKDQTVSGPAGNTGVAAQTGETGDVADAWVEGLE